LAEDAATEQEFENIKASYEQSKANLLALEQKCSKAGASEQQTKVAPVKSQIQQSSANLNNAKLFFLIPSLRHLMMAGLGKKQSRKDN
jgi:membrane fusion protein (multidrug efflux system)